MYISEPYNFVFLANHKTGTRAVARWLQQYYNAICTGNITAVFKAHHYICEEKVWYQNKFVFALTRHPYERLISRYRMMQENVNNTHFNYSFKDFVKAHFLNTIRKPLLSCTQYLSKCPVQVTIIQYDELQIQLLKIPFWNNKYPFIFKQGKSKNLILQYFKDKETYYYANCVFKDDIKEFNYEINHSN